MATTVTSATAGDLHYYSSWNNPSTDRERSPSLFPFPSPDSPGTSSPSTSTVPPRVRSQSPRQSKGLFGCFSKPRGQRLGEGESAGEDNDGDVDFDTQPQPWASSASSFERIPDFEAKISGCRSRGAVSMDLLIKEAELMDNFTKWMEDEHSRENIDCWNDLRQIISLLSSEQISEAISLLSRVNDHFFSPASSAQIGCCELYTPMAELMDLTQSESAVPQEILSSVTNLKQNIEILGLKDGLSRWQMFQLNIPA